MNSAGAKREETGAESALGRVVLSLAGRDAGRLFAVVGEEGERLLLADGRLRRIEAPKRKRRKHAVFLGSGLPDGAARRLRHGGKFSNSELRRMLLQIREETEGAPSPAGEKKRSGQCYRR